MNWEVTYINKAMQDLENLDGMQRKQVLKAIEKVSKNPLPQSEGGYGKALGNQNVSKLSGYFKIKMLKLGLRVVYSLVRETNVMKIIVISIRDDDTVYKIAEKRINS